MSLAALAGMAVVIAGVWTLTARSGHSMAERFSDKGQLLDLSLTALRACIGTDSLAPEQDSAAHQILATVASATGALAPAALLSIVLIKMFTLRPFVWRQRASISRAATERFPNYSQLHTHNESAINAVRFYNRFGNLSFVDLRARAHLRYLERSPSDGSLVVYRKRLEVLGESGEQSDERVWLAVERGAPFTLWIPINGPVTELPITWIQGKDLAQSYGVKLVIRLTARTVHLGTEVADEKWFNLTADDFEFGRFVPLQPDPDKDVWQWEGWADFDALVPPPSGDPTHPAS
ncbi:hypothetical protein [Streptomyces sp. NPDC002692]